MCLDPIKIRNRSKYVNRQTLHKLEFDVPCGQCAECKAVKQNEYYFRSYYQAIECYDKGGYCLFDTLTYDNEHVPHINDVLMEYGVDFQFDEDENFTCFRPEDVRLFFVRLRRHLSYRGYDVKDRLRYFLCSEYGEDPRYTHRPHYHVMFYVMDKQLDPITLSHAIHETWQNGMTDGVDDKGAGYVIGKRVFYAKRDDLHMQSVCHYIGKYMTKDSEFTKTVKQRLNRVKQVLKLRHYKGYNDLQDGLSQSKMIFSEEDKKLLKDIKRHCSQFIRQSQHFGEYMIDVIGKDWIFEHNKVRMPDQEQVWKEIPIPQYIVCKMFKEKKVDSKGNVYYGWSDYGLKFREYHSFESEKSVVDKFKSVMQRGYLEQYYSREQVDKIFKKYDSLMEGRSVEDLFFYQKYVQGRLWIGDVEPDFESYYFADQHELIDEDSLTNGELLVMLNNDLIDDYIYHDVNFDKVLNMYARIKKRIGSFKQAYYDEVCRQQAVWKSQGLKYKNKI